MVPPDVIAPKKPLRSGRETRTSSCDQSLDPLVGGEVLLQHVGILGLVIGSLSVLQGAVGWHTAREVRIQMQPHLPYGHRAPYDGVPRDPPELEPNIL